MLKLFLSVAAGMPIARDDDKKQWACKGKPLYYYARATKADDKTGDGGNNVWKTARP